MAVFASVYKYLLSYSIHCESCPHVTTTRLFIVRLCLLVQEISYPSFNIVRAIKSRRMRWVGHVARMGEERGVCRVLVGKPEGGNHWGDLGIDG